MDPALIRNSRARPRLANNS